MSQRILVALTALTILSLTACDDDGGGGTPLFDVEVTADVPVDAGGDVAPGDVDADAAEPDADADAGVPDADAVDPDADAVEPDADADAVEPDVDAVEPDADAVEPDADADAGDPDADAVEADADAVEPDADAAEPDVDAVEPDADAGPDAAGCTSDVECDDGNECTADVCDLDAGECTWMALDCDDGDPCTTDACDPASGCVYEPIPECPGGCGDGVCEGDETCETCPDDCGVCTTCGDGTCDPGETCEGCPDDCGACPACGDGTCDGDETCDTCPDDCGGCGTCGDGHCTAAEGCDTCAEDCGACGGDCCAAHEGVGCDVDHVTSCVCEADPFCCTDAWDAFCAEAAAGCGADCPACGDGVCEGDETCGTCAEDCGACVCGDGVCDDAETCALCPGDCGPCEGDCCTPHATAGCEQDHVTSCACEVDPFCCEVEWDAICVEAAIEQCGLEGCEVCGDGVCQGAETCETCAGDCGDCFCGDGLCSGLEGCDDCAGDCGPCEGDCCADNGTPGCEDPAVTACVCETDPFCCGTLWDEMCAAAAVESCGLGGCPTTCGDGTCEPGESCDTCPDDCGACVACGDGACEGGEGCHTCPDDCGTCGGDCCADNGTPGCDDPDLTACVCAIDGFCCDTAWDVYCVELAVSSCGLTGCPTTCGDGSCEAAESCATCPDDCGICPTCGDGSCSGDETCLTCADDCGACAGDCCADNGTPGCDDPDVTACACDADPYCCHTAWDAECVDEAVVGCGLACAVCGDGACSGEETCVSCPGDCGGCTGDCCAAHGGPGCEDPDVQACVCDLDPYCCGTAWDALCAQEATACGAGCPGCGDGTCGSDETCDTCPDDCGPCACGDGACNGDETCETCPDDCGPCPTCGDGTCDPGETCASCPGDCGACVGDCCAANGSPGCEDPDVQACVCGADPFCCDTLWDGLCAEEATACDAGCPGCGDGTCGPDETCDTCPDDCGACACGDGACSGDETCETCPDDCGVCPTCGDATCDADEACASCPGDCGDCVGGCCAANGSPGCEDLAVQACVCDADPFCCDTLWDGVCADQAAGCGADCAVCGDAACDPEEDCASCPDDCGTCATPAPGSVIITEIMQNPALIPDDLGEWFEVRNLTGQPVDLAGVTLRDDDTDFHIIHPGGGQTVVPAGGYLVLGRSANVGGVAPGYVYDGFELSNADDEVVLALHEQTLDAVRYDGGPLFPDPSGASMTLSPQAMSAALNNAGSSWCEATSAYGSGELGTPGAPNDACPAGEVP